MLDAVILSDLHLGSGSSQVPRLAELLQQIRSGRLRTRRLILNGDILDSGDLRRLRQAHWRLLALARQVARIVDVLWLTGNHDGPAESIARWLEIELRDEYVLHSGGRSILLFHGHTVDEFLARHPLLTWAGDQIYGLLQWLDSTHSLARLAKNSNTAYRESIRQIQERAVACARERGLDAVCCGHTHLAAVDEEGPVAYYNSGCWTELPGTYLTVQEGEVRLHHHAPGADIFSPQRNLEPSAGLD